MFLCGCGPVGRITQVATRPVCSENLHIYPHGAVHAAYPQTTVEHSVSDFRRQGIDAHFLSGGRYVAEITSAVRHVAQRVDDLVVDRPEAAEPNLSANLPVRSRLNASE